MAFNISDLSPAQIHRGMTCKSLDEFQAFVTDEGIDLYEQEAQAIFEEMYETELSDEELEAVSGGNWATDCLSNRCVERDNCTDFSLISRRKRK